MFLLHVLIIPILTKNSGNNRVSRVFSVGDLEIQHFEIYDGQAEHASNGTLSIDIYTQQA